MLTEEERNNRTRWKGRCDKLKMDCVVFWQCVCGRVCVCVGGAGAHFAAHGRGHLHIALLFSHSTVHHPLQPQCFISCLEQPPKYSPFNCSVAQYGG